MIRRAFQDSTFLGKEGGREMERKMEVEERGRESDEKMDFNASLGVSLLGTLWLNDQASSRDAVLIHINTDLIQNNPLFLNRFYSGAQTHFFIFYSK